MSKRHKDYSIEQPIIIMGEDNDLKRAEQKVYDKVEEKAQRIREYRREASRLAALANKRVQRLEKNGLQNSPAYQGYLKSGGEKFGVRGKDYNEVQAEVARMRAFIDAKTSTIRGVNSYLKEMAENTGIKYSNLTELKEKADKFFELSSKVEQYLRTVEDMASAIGYQKIWESINIYVKENNIELENANTSVDDLIKQVSDAIIEHERPEKVEFENVLETTNWFKLKKE